jgi:phospholipase/lecithinase/hemolysin
LASELRAAGQDDDAAAVKKLRKPSVVAWALNAAAREAPDDVSALLEAGDDLFVATETRKRATRAVADRAVEALGARGATHRDRIVSTLEAASLDRELGQRLRDGTLDRDAQPTSGFGAIEGFEVLEGGAAAEQKPTELAEARRERAREAKEAERAAIKAERAAEQAAVRAVDLRAKAVAAEAAAREAEADAKRLADEAKMARKRADRASRD